MRFNLSFDRQRQVHSHLVTIEVGVEALANEWMQVDCVAFDQYRLKCLNAHSVQGWSTIQQDRVILDHRFQDVPDLFIFTLKHLLGALDRVRVAHLLEFADDERLVEFECDFLWKSALVQFESRAHHNDTSCRVVDPFSEKVFTKSSLFTFDHVGQRFQGAIAASQHRAFAPIIVEQRVD